MGPEASERGPTLTFVVPVYQEVDGVDALVRALVAGGERAVDETALVAWDAVLVDDGSTDGSGAALDRAAAAEPALRVVHHPDNGGLGAALATGLSAAAGDVVVYLDADLPFDLAEVPRLVGPLLADEVDVVSARRRGRAREGRRRAVQSAAYNLLVRVVIGVPVSDVNFACKAARREAVPPELVSRSGLVDVEWLAWAHRRGLRIAQPRVEFRPRAWGRSTLGGVATIPRMVWEMVLLRRRLSAPRRRVLAAYRGEPTAVRAHLRARWASAPFEAVVAAVGDATSVVEVGCGHGLLATRLAEGPGRSVLGVDVDPDRLVVARRAAGRPGARRDLRFEAIDADWSPPPADAVVIADVLYLLAPAARRELVDRCAAALGPGGRLAVLDLDDRPRWKAVLAQAQERLAAPLLTHPAGRVGRPPPARVVAGWLAEAGLEVTVRRADRGRPWPHYVAVGRRPVGGAPTGAC